MRKRNKPLPLDHDKKLREGRAHDHVHHGPVPRSMVMFNPGSIPYYEPLLRDTVMITQNVPLRNTQDH